MITVNLGEFTLTKSINNLTWKHLVKASVLLTLVLLEEMVWSAQKFTEIIMA